MKPSFNYRSLELARNSRGITQKDFADILGVTQAIISHWERNYRQPSDDNINTIAKALDYPVDFFYNQEGHSYLPAVQGHYRKKASLKASSRLKLEAHFMLIGDWVSRLQDAVEPEDGIAIPDFEVSEDEKSDPAQVARTIRRKWNIPNGPIKSIIKVLEKNKIVTLMSWMKDDNIDAYSFYTSSGNPVIYINDNFTLDRIRFSIAHELGHLLMHSDSLPDPEKENEANIFASEFLMPSYDIAEQLDDLTLNVLPSLKTYWGCSMASLAYRGLQLGRISQVQYKNLVIDLSPYKKKEPIDISKHGFYENPSLLKAMIKCHFDDLEFTEDELMKLMMLNRGDFNLLLSSAGYDNRNMFISKSA